MDNFKGVLYGDEARQAIVDGVNRISDVVKVSFGPSGNNGIISETDKEPYVTKDGVTLAKSYPSEYTFQGVGIDLIKSIATRADKLSGDGTTTATILAQIMMNLSNQSIKDNPKINKIRLKNAMYEILADVEDKLKEYRVVDVTDSMLHSIANTSVNGDDEISRQLTDVFIKVNRSQGIVGLQAGVKSTDEVRFSNGFRVNKPYLSTSFINVQSQGIYKLDDCYVFIFDDYLEDSGLVMPLINKVFDNLGKELSEGCNIVIVARGFHNLMLTDIKYIMERSPSVKLMPVVMHGFGDNQGELLEDLSCITGGEIIRKGQYNEAKEGTKCMGSIKSVFQDGNDTVFHFDQKVKDRAKFKERVSHINEILNMEDILPSDKKMIQERYSNIQSSLATIFVGGVSDVEIFEKLDRYTDALNSLIKADKEGILTGSGLPLMLIGNSLDKADYTQYPEMDVAFDIISETLKTPFRQILKNAHLDDDEIKYHEDMAIRFNGDKVYNLVDDEFISTKEYRIVDPYMVTKNSLEVAVKMVATFLTNQVIILNNANIFNHV